VSSDWERLTGDAVIYSTGEVDELAALLHDASEEIQSLREGIVEVRAGEAAATRMAKAAREESTRAINVARRMDAVNQDAVRTLGTSSVYPFEEPESHGSSAVAPARFLGAAGGDLIHSSNAVNEHNRREKLLSGRWNEASEIHCLRSVITERGHRDRIAYHMNNEEETTRSTFQKGDAAYGRPHISDGQNLRMQSERVLWAKRQEEGKLAIPPSEVKKMLNSLKVICILLICSI